jgi:hypothetical protein
MLGEECLGTLRLLAIGLIVIGGPVCGVLAGRLFDMGPYESLAIVALISGWLGPRLLTRRPAAHRARSRSARRELGFSEAI